MTGAYTQDPIAPFLVEHRMDFGDPEPGRPDSFGHVYNYLDYGFREDGRELWARHYLDEPDTVILNGADEPMLGDPFVRRVMIFLGMRYGKMDVITPRGRMNLPADAAAALAEAVRAHMIRAAV